MYLVMYVVFTDVLFCSFNIYPKLCNRFLVHSSKPSTGDGVNQVISIISIDE